MELNSQNDNAELTLMSSLAFSKAISRPIVGGYRTPVGPISFESVTLAAYTPLLAMLRLRELHLRATQVATTYTFQSIAALAPAEANRLYSEQVQANLGHLLILDHTDQAVLGLELLQAIEQLNDTRGLEPIFLSILKQLRQFGYDDIYDYGFGVIDDLGMPGDIGGGNGSFPILDTLKNRVGIFGTQALDKFQEGLNGGPDPFGSELDRIGGKPGFGTFDFDQPGFQRGSGRPSGRPGASDGPGSQGLTDGQKAGIIELAGAIIGGYLGGAGGGILGIIAGTAGGPPTQAAGAVAGMIGGAHEGIQAGTAVGSAIAKIVYPEKPPVTSGAGGSSGGTPAPTGGGGTSGGTPPSDGGGGTKMNPDGPDGGIDDGTKPDRPQLGTSNTKPKGRGTKALVDLSDDSTEDRMCFEMRRVPKLAPGAKRVAKPGFLVGIVNSNRPGSGATDPVPYATIVKDALAVSAIDTSTLQGLVRFRNLV